MIFSARIRSFLAALIAALLLLGGARGPVFASDEILTSFQVNYNLPAVVGIVVRDARTEFFSARGLSNVGSRTEMTPLTDIQLGAISKLMTGMALVELLASKHIDAESDIAPYAPAYLDDRAHLTSCTFRDLLLHTTGIPLTRANTVQTEAPSAGFAESARGFFGRYRLRPVLPRGEYTMYSNVGAILAGTLIEEISGKSFENYMSERFYSMLGMRRTARLMLDPADAKPAGTYIAFGGRLSPAKPLRASLTASDDLLTTAGDMELFLRYLTNNIDKLRENGILSRVFGNNPLTQGRSYGFRVVDYRGEEAFLIDGAVPGAYSRILVIPRLSLGMFLYYNSDSIEAREALTDALLDDYVGDRGSLQKYDYVETQNLSKLAARYSPINRSSETVEQLIGLSHQISVSRIDGGLLIGRDFYRPLSETYFYCEQRDSFAEFRTDGEGRLLYLIVGDEIYRRTLPYQSAVLFGALFALAMVGIAGTLVFVVRRWNQLHFERIDSRPRTIVLLHSLLMLIWMTVFFAVARSLDYWTLSYAPSLLQRLLYYGGWTIPISTGFMIFAVVQTKGDYKWRGGIAFLSRLNAFFSAGFFVALYHYNLIWTFL